MGKTFPDYFEALFAVAGARADDIPVIAIDGPSASGKGTWRRALAQALGYVHLDRRALYRATAPPPATQGWPTRTATAPRGLPQRWTCASTAGGRCSPAATRRRCAARRGGRRARVADFRLAAGARGALHGLQLSFRRLPGLVADGRDMGSVVSLGARLKVFLTASAAERSGRGAASN